MSYATKRYWFYAFVTVITFVMPFITVNQNHLLLLSFEKLGVMKKREAKKPQKTSLPCGFVKGFLKWIVKKHQEVPKL